MASSALLHVAGVHKKFGDLVTAAGVSFCVDNGEFVTMLGPSGSGKSTVLRMIAGLEQPDAGRIVIAGQDVTNLPPWQRNLGMVFQQYANFPHMTVAENVSYGLRRKKLDRVAIAKRISELLELVNLPGFERRAVTRLSGGEQQRVAIARALAPKPRLLLLDEPLSALDEKIRREMQTQLKDIQRATGTAFIYVTHDQEEALTMSDRVAVLNRGHLVQIDKPHALFRRPRTKFVAEFFRGSNVVSGRLDRLAEGDVFTCPSFTLPVTGRVAKPADPPAVAIRAEDLRINAGDVHPGDIVFTAVLDRFTYRGVYTDYLMQLSDGQTVTASATSELQLTPRQSLELAIARDRVVLLEAEP